MTELKHIDRFAQQLYGEANGSCDDTKWWSLSLETREAWRDKAQAIIEAGEPTQATE